jgi:hypothetical protein
MDWRLPRQDELEQIFIGRHATREAFNFAGGLVTTSTEGFWTSSPGGEEGEHLVFYKGHAWAKKDMLDHMAKDRQGIFVPICVRDPRVQEQTIAGAAAPR